MPTDEEIRKWDRELRSNPGDLNLLAKLSRAVMTKDEAEFDSGLPIASHVVYFRPQPKWFAENIAASNAFWQAVIKRVLNRESAPGELSYLGVSSFRNSVLRRKEDLLIPPESEIGLIPIARTYSKETAEAIVDYLNP